MPLNEENCEEAQDQGWNDGAHREPTCTSWGWGGAQPAIQPSERLVEEERIEEEIFIELGGSMLKRFQLKEKDTEKHRVQDRLLLTKKIELADEQFALPI